MEKLAANGEFSPAKIADNSEVTNISPPDNLTAAWKNINTKAELEKQRGDGEKIAERKE